MILLPTLLLACCIDSPPFIPVSQPRVIEVGDGGLTSDQLLHLDRGVVYTVESHGEFAGTVEIMPSETVETYPVAQEPAADTDILQQPDAAPDKEPQ